MTSLTLPPGPAAFFEGLEKRGHLPAWQEADGNVLSYAGLAAALKLLRETLPPSPILALHEANSPQLATLLLAGWSSGKTMLPLLHRWPAASARDFARACGAGALWQGGQWHGLEPSPSAPPAGPHSLLLTSGSSGPPKAVLHSLEAHLASARASQVLLPLGPDSVWLLNLPLAHVSGLAILIRCLWHGASLRFTLPGESAPPPETTHLSLVAPQLSRLVGQIEANSPPALASLRAILAGGGPFPLPLLQSARAHGLPIFLTYGMTETASQICTGLLSEIMTEPPGCGWPLPGWEVRQNAHGELEVRGASLAKGYWPMRLPDSSGQPSTSLVPLTDAEGWFATGDIGRLDPATGWCLTGRRDRMFISGGENIHPETIEDRLAELPGVRRVRVVPRPDPTFGQRPVAFIDGDLSPAEAQAALRRCLPGFAIPDIILPWPPGVGGDGGKLCDADFPVF